MLRTQYAEPAVVPAVGTAVTKRISWAAVFGGVVVMLVVQLMLGLLGLGIGSTTIDPLSEQS